MTESGSFGHKETSQSKLITRTILQITTSIQYKRLIKMLGCNKASLLLMALAAPTRQHPTAFVMISTTTPLQRGRINNHLSRQQSSHLIDVLNMMMMGSHRIADDDDISQHEYSISPTTNNNDIDENINDENSDASSTTNGSGGGYRRIEEWHEDHINENPEEHHAITHLKREKARWARAFESLDGGGI